MKYLIPLWMFLFLFACSNEKNAARKFNDSIIIHQVHLMDNLNVLNELIEKKDTAALRAHYILMQEEIKKAIPEAEAVEPYKGGEVMKEKVVDLLKFYDQLLKENYKEYFDKLSADSVDQDELKSILTGIQFRELMAVQLERELGEAQDSFARLVGFTVQRDSSSEK